MRIRMGVNYFTGSRSSFGDGQRVCVGVSYFLWLSRRGSLTGDPGQRERRISLQLGDDVHER